MKLFKNGNIRTMEKDTPTAEAFVVDGNQFVFVGSEAEARQFAEASGLPYEVCDLAGKLVLPAFNDSHMHFVHLAKGLLSVDLNGVRSITELIERMKTGLLTHRPAPGTWLEGEGWNHDFFQDEVRFPTKFDLDQVSTEVPLLIMRTCFHIGVLNSAALKLLGITEETAAPYGDLVGRTASGELNGVIKESLLDDVKAQISVLNKQLLKELILKAQEKLFAEGLVSVQSDDIGYMPDWSYDLFFQVLQELTAEGTLKMRLGEQVLLQEPALIQRFFDQGYHYGPITEHYGITSIKLLNDGSLGARTAALRAPYADDSTTSGLLMFTPAALDQLVLTAQQNGYPVAIHAIGDRAIETALNAIEKAQKSAPQPRLRHGIVHCQITDEALLDRFAQLDVLALVQPIFIDYDMNIVEARVGSALATTSYAWKSLLKRGVHVSFGTDCPVESYQVMPNLYAAVTRQSISSPEKKAYQPDERVSMEEALRAYTWEGAYASGEEARKGSIAAGKLADFIVLDRDLFTEAEAEILQTKVLKTYVDGELVYPL